MRKVLLNIFITLSCFVGLAQDFESFVNSPYVDHYSNVIPQTPNASQFSSYGNIPVDYSTGVPTISIPLYTLVVDGVEVPISISYHAAGVKVEDLASVVGLKWTLHAGGGIFRSISGGKADEEGWLDPLTSFFDSSWYTTNSIGSYVTQDKLKSTDRDHNPDNFNYYFLNNSGQFIFKPKTGLTTPVIMKERLDKLSIIPDFDVTLKKLDAFTIKDYNGVIYEFGNGLNFKESNENTSSTISIGNYSWSQSLAFKNTGWMLDEITSKNSQTISFGYDPYQFTYQNLVSQRIRLQPIGDPQNCWEASTGDDTEILESSNVIYKPKNQLITSIYSDAINIQFIYSDDSSASDWKRKLDKIIIKDNISNQQKEFRFVYGRFSGDPRLKLQEVYEVGFDGQVKPSYVFTYNEAYLLPEKGSMSKDYFGYYNGKSNSLLVPYTTPAYIALGNYKNQLADRTVDNLKVQAGVLTKIQYPTGGTTEFIYESNRNGTTLQGGLRIKELKDIDGEGKTYNQTFYTYDGYQGLAWQGTNTVKNFGTSMVYSSDFIITDASLFMQGYYYDKVTIKRQKSSTEFITSEYHFTDNSTLNKFSSLPKETIFFKNTDTIQKKEYQYFRSIEETIYWNQLGDMDNCYQRLGKSLVGYNTPTNTYYRTYKHLLTTESTTNFSEDLPNEFATSAVINKYFYNSNLLVTNETNDGRYNTSYDANKGADNFDPNGIIQSIATTYPSDYPSEQTLQNLVTTKNLVSLPISKIVTNNGLQTQGQFFTYDTSGNIKESYRYNKGNETNSSSTGYIPDNYKLHISYSHQNGKPTDIQRDGGTPVSYIWGYKKSLPIAKIENATYSQIATTAASLQSLSNADDSDADEEALRTALDAFRNNSLFASAMITTYTYNLLSGVTSITDPKGLRVYYHYDEFGRLEKVTDQNGKVLSKNEYDFKD